MDSAHERDPDGNLVLTESYFDRRVYRDEIERDGLRMVFESRHWTLQDYVDAVLGAGFRIEALREVGDPGDTRWSGYPLYLHLVAAKASQPG